jgi:hypothetical protein
VADTKDKADDQEELVAVEGAEDADAVAPGEETADSKGESKDKKGEKDDSNEESDEPDDPDEPDEPEEAAAKDGDARVATDEDADNTDARSKRKETAKERRQRQKKRIEARERELNLYKARNEELERRFSTLEARQSRGEQITIGQAITTVEGQIAEARRLEAEAIKAQDGETAVEAREVREALEGKRDRLVAAKERVAKTTSGTRTPPPEMRQALSWIDKNKDWYDPKGGNEESAIASAIEDRLTREGKLDPASAEFWQELDRRLIKRGIKKGKVSDEESEEGEFEELDEKDEKPGKGAKSNGNGHDKSNGKSNGKGNGGPKVTVGGEKRSLKANEVYIDPGRKQAMIEAGVWDDPKQRQEMLRRYHQFDRDARASR